MSDPTREQVQRAYELIKSGHRTEALHILQQVILMDDRNVDAWWLMANITQTPADRRVALDHVLKLKPNHARAKRMLAQLVEQHPALAEKPAILKARPEPVKPKPARSRVARAAPPRRRDADGRDQRLLITLAVAVLVVIVVFVVVLLVSGGL